jgi:RimJ/RimL family protein N-acetyltransferase
VPGRRDYRNSAESIRRPSGTQTDTQIEPWTCGLRVEADPSDAYSRNADLLCYGVHRLVHPEPWNPDFRSAALGYWFDDAAWDLGYATEAGRELLRWASGEVSDSWFYGLIRRQWRPWSEPAPAR